MIRFFVILAILFSSAASAAESSEKSKELDKLLKHLGYDDSLPRMLSSLSRIYRTTYAHLNLPSEVWDEVWREINYEDLRALSVKLYDDSLTIEEIKAANAFYESDVGRSYAKKVSDIGEKEFSAGREWAKQKFDSVVQRYQKRNAQKK